jgi:hypothetical protein
VLIGDQVYHFAQSHVHVLGAAQDRAQRGSYVARSYVTRRDLVEQGLKEVKIWFAPLLLLCHGRGSMPACADSCSGFSGRQAGKKILRPVQIGPSRQP